MLIQDLTTTFEYYSNIYDFYFYKSFLVLIFAQNTDNMAIVNKDLIQSYIMTTAKYDFNVYENG